MPPGLGPTSGQGRDAPGLSAAVRRKGRRRDKIPLLSYHQKQGERQTLQNCKVGVPGAAGEKGSIIIAYFPGSDNDSSGTAGAAGGEKAAEASRPGSLGKEKPRHHGGDRSTAAEKPARGPEDKRNDPRLFCYSFP